MRKYFLIPLLLFSSGCAYLQSVSLTQIPSDRSRVVEAYSSKLIWFAFNFSNDYVDDVTSQLKEKCQGGTVTGILTKDEMVMYFPLIVHKRSVTAKGYCNKG